jgi:hypothetical protein
MAARSSGEGDRSGRGVEGLGFGPRRPGGGGVSWLVGWWEGVFGKCLGGVCCKKHLHIDFSFFEWK